ncbi:hypothetical protein PI125_g11095 [Phytophthora idaei]|nr:hypothetical protein PI125_g11095 [Phytophthora idaei]
MTRQTSKALSVGQVSTRRSRRPICAPKRYERVIARATSKYDIDEDGYIGINDLLEQTTGSIQPGGDPRKPHWVDNRTRGPRKALLPNSSLRLTQLEVLKLLHAGKSVAQYDNKPFKLSEQKEYDSDFEDEDRNFTALPPTPPIDGLDVAETISHSGSEDDDDAPKDSEDDANQDEEGEEDEEKKPASPATPSPDKSSSPSTK